MSSKYPDALEVAAGAFSLPIPEEEVAMVRDFLKSPRSSSPYHLINFGRDFCKKFVPHRVSIMYESRGKDSYNHSTGAVTIGTVEIIRLLHEIGHARYGKSEHQAVFYSIGLLMRALPDFVPELNGHKLLNDPL